MPEPPSEENLPLRLSSEAILKLVAETAYFRAEQRGFVPGYEIEDWLEAEKEIMARTESPVDKAN